MKHIYIVLLTLLWGNHSLLAQTPVSKDYSRNFDRAVASADKADYASAIVLYSHILEKSPNDVDALTQLGFCLLTTNQKLDSALLLFNKAFSLVPTPERYNPFGIYLQRAIAHTHNLKYEPEKALALLSVLRDSVTDAEQKAEIGQEMVQTRNAAVLLKNPVPLKISNLTTSINSVYDDHSPLVSLKDNRIFFTSRRPVGRDTKLPDGQYPEKVFLAESDGNIWQAPKPIKAFSSRLEHKSLLSLSPDESQIYLYKNDEQGKSIYVSNYKDGLWQEPTKLPNPINSEWDETHASLSPDQSTLFFTSSRPGGFGGLDIYMIKKDNYGNWGQAINMGPSINTEKDEETPMLHPDGKTLYFASEGHSAMGGFDVFFSQKQSDESWISAVNMGFPINSPDDDFFFVPTLDKSQAYFASYRFSENTGNSDIFKVNFDSTYRGALAVIEGTIENADNLPPEHIRILVSREADNLPVGDFRPNPATGKYLLFLESGQSYRIQEATPESIGQEEVIHVADEMAFSESRQVVMVQDVNTWSPLIPTPMLTAINQEINLSVEETSNQVIQDPQMSYTVQILALKKTPKVRQDFFNGLNEQMIHALKGQDGFLRYIIGQFSTKNEADQYLAEVKKIDRFNDAWVRTREPLLRASEH